MDDEQPQSGDSIPEYRKAKAELQTITVVRMVEEDLGNQLDSALLKKDVVLL